MANRPAFPTFIDRSASNIDPDYDENPLTITGFQPGDPVPSQIHNTLWLTDGLWQVYLDYGVLRTDDALDTATDQRWSATRLGYTNGDSTKTVGAVPARYGVYYVDGQRIEIDEYLLKPAGAQPLLKPDVVYPARLWIYLDYSTSPPLYPTARVRVERVDPATAETPGATEIALVGVDVDAAGLITGNTYPAVEPVNEIIYGTLDQRWRGPTTFEALVSITTPGSLGLDVTGQAAIDGAALTALTLRNNAATPTLLVENPGGQGVAVVVTSATNGALFQNDGAGESLRVEKTVAGTGVVVDTTAGGGDGMDISAATANGITVTADIAGVDATSEGAALLGNTTDGIGVRGLVVGAGAGTGVNGIGGNDASSLAGEFTATNTGATALVVSSAVGAASSAVAVQSQGFGAATGVYALSQNGYGLIAESDTSSPTTAAARLVPQDDDPSTPAQGDLLFNSSRSATGKLRTRTTQWESVHSSAKGRTENWGAASSGSTAGGSGALSLVQINPEETGDVHVEATGTLDFNTDAASCTVAIWATDGGAPVLIASQPEVAIDIDSGATSGRDRSFIIRGTYTIPSLLYDQFYTVITALSGTITWGNVITAAKGVF